MKTKRVRPVLVEIKDASNIFENNDKTLSFYEYKQHASSGGKKFELILISLEDEKIEEGDEFVHYWFNENSTNKDRIVVSTADKNTNDKKHRKSFIGKVIARQSQISPEYISKFIELYNKGCIEDLEIEMEKCWINSDNVKGNSFTEVAKFEPSINDFDAVLIIQPKLTNGFVTIVEKELITYTENDMRDAFEAGHKLGWSGYPNTDNWTQPKFEEWFNKNKKK